MTKEMKKMRDGFNAVMEEFGELAFLTKAAMAIAAQRPTELEDYFTRVVPTDELRGQIRYIMHGFIIKMDPQYWKHPERRFDEPVKAPA